MRDKALPWFLLSALAILTLPARLPAADWPQWRGPNGDGTSPERGLPLKWSKTENVAWRLALPGPAGSTPAVWGDRIFVASVEGTDIVLLCVSTAGKEIWKRKFGSGSRDFMRDEGNSAAPSPSTDGKHAWAYAGTGDLACFDFDGNQVWKANLQERHGEFDHWHGMSSTPLLAGDRLYQMCLRMKDPYIVAIDKLTGKEVWKRARETEAEHESRHSYASPILYRDEKQALLLIHGGDCLSAHRLEDGEEVWRCGSLNPRDNYNRFLRFIASPVCTPGLVIAPSAKGNPVVAVRPDGKGDVTGTKSIAWRRDRDTTDVPTPAIHDGLVYLLRENGVLICLDAAKGEEVYTQRLHRTRQRASPVVADGKVYCASRDGDVFVVRPGRKFELLAENAMGEPIASTPVAAGGRLYIRTFEALYAIEGPR
ncbi:MAG: PQQ-binding-like beta-propeller repeat protein [Planctomycetes bacterium]|nr:PQQ-binding-like beta-propeller repeat protein [Planctomycetota bacterium]